MLLKSLDEAFGVEFEKDVIIGVEMEVYVLDASDQFIYLLEDRDVIEDIYNEFDERVYKDYYTYQLEIRTNPSDDWKEVARELIELIAKVSKVARERDCCIAPVSHITGAMFNGFHVHISYRPEMNFENMVRHAFAMYPFMLDVTRLTLSAPYKNREYGAILSLRQLDSPHIGVPPLHYTIDKLENYWIWDEEARAGNRYHDIIINTNRKEGRHRIKNVDTIEIRMFDCVGSKRYIKYVLETVYTIAKFINPEWFWKYHHNRDFMIKLKNLIQNLKLLLVQPLDWLNPLTMAKIWELQEFLGISTCNDYPWIHHCYLILDNICKPDTHKDLRYPLE